jgi:hypothetical protein
MQNRVHQPEALLLASELLMPSVPAGCRINERFINLQTQKPLK